MSRYLPIALKNMSITLGHIVEAMAKAPEYKLQYFARLTDLYRHLALGDFLMTDEPEGMFYHLRLGAQAFVEFLNQAEEPEKATSKATVYFDAVCAEDWQVAKEIATLTPGRVNDRKEYEEEFLYMRTIMDYFSLGKGMDDIQGMLNRYEALHQEHADQHFVLLQALLEKNVDQFESALEMLVDDIREKKGGGGHLYEGTLDQAAVLPHISTEVMAWIKLARKQGMAVQEEYLLAPAAAMVSLPNDILPAGEWLQYEGFSSLVDG